MGFSGLQWHYYYELKGTVYDNTPEATAVKELYLFDKRIYKGEDIYGGERTWVNVIKITDTIALDFKLVSKGDTPFSAGELKAERKYTLNHLGVIAIILFFTIMFLCIPFMWMDESGSGYGDSL